METTQKTLSELTDHELLQEAKRVKSARVLNALLIGFLIGIVFYSVVKSSYGLATLFPLYMAYRLVNNSKYDTTALEKILKERSLK